MFSCGLDVGSTPVRALSMVVNREMLDIVVQTNEWAVIDTSAVLTQTRGPIRVDPRSGNDHLDTRHIEASKLIAPTAAYTRALAISSEGTVLSGIFGRCRVYDVDIEKRFAV